MSDEALIPTPATPTGSVRVLEPPAPPVDWEAAFRCLVLLTCTGFISARAVERWVDILRRVDPRAADIVVTVFNRHRNPLVQALTD